MAKSVRQPIEGKKVWRVGKVRNLFLQPPCRSILGAAWSGLEKGGSHCLDSDLFMSAPFALANNRNGIVMGNKLNESELNKDFDGFTREEQLEVISKMEKRLIILRNRLHESDGVQIPSMLVFAPFRRGFRSWN